MIDLQSMGLIRFLANHEEHDPSNYIDYFIDQFKIDSENLKGFSEKDKEIVASVGSGYYGIAFYTESDKILKITGSKFEYEMSKFFLENDPGEGFAKIYAVGKSSAMDKKIAKKIKKNNKRDFFSEERLYYILREYLPEYKNYYYVRMNYDSIAYYSAINESSFLSMTKSYFEIWGKLIKKYESKTKKSRVFYVDNLLSKEDLEIDFFEFHHSEKIDFMEKKLEEKNLSVKEISMMFSLIIQIFERSYHMASIAHSLKKLLKEGIITYDLRAPNIGYRVFNKNGKRLNQEEVLNSISGIKHELYIEFVLFDPGKIIIT